MPQAKPSRICLQMQVPRSNVRGPIAFEQILASLHGLCLKKAQGIEAETISFEIAKIKNQIIFYLSVPTHLKNYVSSTLYGQYPSVEIIEVPDYFNKKLIQGKKLITGSLRPAEPWVFPFKRHPQFEDKYNQRIEDPLGPMTAALAQLHKSTDSAVIQFVVRPVKPQWNSAARMTLKRFSGTGIWQFDWFRKLYQWARLSPDKSTRMVRSPLWVFLETVFGWMGRSGHSSDENNRPDPLQREEQTSGRHEQESVYSAGYDKLSRLNFATNIRMLYLHSDPSPLEAESKMKEILGTFQQFSQVQMNYFSISSFEMGLKSVLFERLVKRKQKSPFVLSQEELATMYHLPTETVTTPSIDWVDSVKLEPPIDLPQETETDITLMGQTNFRGSQQLYGILPEDRRRHVYVIGKTGMGKSTLLENMIESDIKKGRGVAVIDPHGDLAENILSFIPSHRTNDVILFDPSDTKFPVAFNLLEAKDIEQRTLIASGLLNVFKKLYAESWGPRLEHFLRNTILALIEAPDTTLLGIPRMLVDKTYRMKILHYVKDPMVQNFWQTEFDALAPAKLAEAVGPIQNKVGQFLSSPAMRNILGQPKSSLDIRFAMDHQKIVIINLSKGKIGEDNSAMLGSLMITKFQLDAMSRANILEKDRKDFYLYVDEFQNFATDSFATILSEARKYRLNLTMANQYIDQMPEEVRSAVFGNVGSIVSFQVGISDAQILSEQLDEERVPPLYLAGLPKYKIYNRIMVEGMTTPTFSADTLPPPKIEYKKGEDRAIRIEKIQKFSRERYAKPQEAVEQKILRWSRPESEKKSGQKIPPEAKGSGAKPKKSLTKS